MTTEFTFSINTTRFDEDYAPSEHSRTTTNFANLARGEHRKKNLQGALTMIERRFNDLANWDNPDGKRYRLKLDIVSASLNFVVAQEDLEFPLIELLDCTIIDTQTGKQHQGIVGNNFSSYVRDYDFSVRLPEVNSGGGFSIPADFGDLHGKLFQHFLESDAYRSRYALPPVVCISVSTSKSYTRTTNTHPILGVEYSQPDGSLTDEYFGKMGLKVRYFMPQGSVAPLAFYFRGDLLNDYTNLQLIGTISTMETFQKIYRPEIYNANAGAEALYSPTLNQQNFSPTQIGYDRAERSQLGVKQGAYTHKHLIAPHGAVLDAWAAKRATPVA